MADDDLDELLDEVEKKFCSNVSVSSSCVRDSTEVEKCSKDTEGQRKPRNTNSVNNMTADIDALLEDLLDEDYGDSVLPKTKLSPEQTQSEKKLQSQSGGRKCCPVFIGGSLSTNGIGTITSKRSCDQLRCVSCDFRVLMFDDWEWDKSCDYLFLRNNMPERQKLKSRLRRRRGCRAYACQCSWTSALEPTDLREQAQLRWVCGKHQD